MGRLKDGVRSDRGATALMVAGSMFLLLGVAAIAVDLSALRTDIRADRLATDAAAVAGASAINPFAASAADQACQVAWEYLLLNLATDGVDQDPPNCAVFSGGCPNPSAAREATASAGPYSFVITHPVPDGHALLTGQGLNEEIDGAPCQRLGVSATLDRAFTFARVLGFDTGATRVHSVARIGPGVGAGEVVPLLVLDPIACNALYTSGQGKVTVRFFEPDTPGFIVVDSDGSKSNQPNRCQSNRYTIESQGTQKGWIRALPTPSGIPAAILSYALSGNEGADPERSYNPSNLNDPVNPADNPEGPSFTWFRLYPEPIGVSRRITRAPIDWRYNCKATYDPYPIDLNNPGLGGIPVDSCPRDPAPHIDQHVATYGQIGSQPMGFQRWTQFPDGTPRFPCTVDKDTWPSETLSVTGNWWVDCDAFVVNGGQNKDPIDLDNPPRIVTFSDGNVVFEGGVELKSFGELHVNPNSSADRFVYVREGDLRKGAQTAITLEQVFVYLSETGRVNLGGGAGSDSLIWTAPLEGPFEDLALWAEAPLTFEIGGQAGNTLTGTFFTPLADPFVLTGQGDFKVDLRAQFISRRLEVKGQAVVNLTPDPDRSTEIPIRQIRLIR